MRISIGAFEVAYDLEGPPDAPVGALGHCFSANRDLWRHQVKPLIEAGYRVLRHDVRGHGQTPGLPLPYTLEDKADDIAALLDALSIERVHYCGISMSGMIAQWFAINHGGRLHSLVLANTSSAYSTEQRAGWNDRMRVLERDGSEAVLEGAMSRWFTRESLARKVYGVALIRHGFTAMDPSVRLAIMRNIATVETTQRLREITVPTLVITGSEDVATPVETGQIIHERIAGSQLTTIDGAGHLSPCERPTAFNRALLEFLAPGSGRQTGSERCAAVIL